MNQLNECSAQTNKRAQIDLSVRFGHVSNLDLVVVTNYNNQALRSAQTDWQQGRVRRAGPSRQMNY